jgi:hypothetical protein
MAKRHWVHAGLALLLSVTAAGGVQFDASLQSHRSDLGYDGRFTFVRLRWGSDLGFSRRGGFGSAWNHDYPRAERHLSLILDELTALDIHTEGSLILPLDDPELFKYPVAFMWEPGFWNLTDREAAAFRAYLLKGDLRFSKTSMAGISGLFSRRRCAACFLMPGSSASITHTTSSTRSSW